MQIEIHLDGLIRIVQPDESRLDHFVVANVMMNSIYIENLRVLSELFAQVKDSNISSNVWARYGWGKFGVAWGT